jgi:hypothetical protein
LYKQDISDLGKLLNSLFFNSSIHPRAGVVFAATQEEGKNFDQAGKWQISIHTGKDDELILRISTYDLELEGMQLRVSAKEWQHLATLTRVGEDQVGAKIILSKEEAAMLSAKENFQVDFVNRDGSSAIISK